MRKIGPDIYVTTGSRGGNIGLIVTEEGVAVIDTPMLSWEMSKLRKEMAKATDRRVAFVVNTDHHKEKCLGNRFFPEAVIIAHDLTWKEMKSYGETWHQRLLESLRISDPKAAADLEDFQVVLPHITFSDKMTLYIGSKVLQVFCIGGHTPGSSMVYDAEAGVLFSGDAVVNGVHPFLGGADSKKWLEALTRIRKLRVETIVPGQGNVCDKEATQQVSAYVRQMRAKVRHLYNTGHSKAETVGALARMLDLFPVAKDERENIEQDFKASVGRVYDEMKAGGGS